MAESIKRKYSKGRGRRGIDSLISGYGNKKLIIAFIKLPDKPLTFSRRDQPYRVRRIA